METKLWPQLALTALVVGVLIGGFVTVGGPESGRVEQRDDQRYRDLIAYQSQLICLARADGNTALPAKIADTVTCSIHLSDDALLPNEGYHYLPQDDGTYQICASFENVDALRKRQRRTDISDEGCLSGKID
jgi:hypothetical protein